MTTSRITTSPITIVALHGNGGGGFRFSRLPSPLREVDDLHPAVTIDAIDLPGFGRTPLRVDPPTMEDFVDFVADHLHGIEGPRVLLGHGIGGSIALSILQRDDVSIDGLILHALVGVDLDRRWFPLLMKPMWMRTMAKRIISSAPVRMAARDRLFGPDVPSEFADRFLAEYGTCDGFEAMFDLLTPEWFDALSPVPTPTALLWGSNDRILKAGHTTGFEPLLPRSTTRIVPGWGHFPMVDHPNQYGAEIARLAIDLVDTPRDG